jgi:hypothetical protein
MKELGRKNETILLTIYRETIPKFNDLQDKSCKAMVYQIDFW